MEFIDIQRKFDTFQNFGKNGLEFLTKFLGSMRKHSNDGVSFENWYKTNNDFVKALNLYLGKLRMSDLTYPELEFVYKSLECSQKH